MNKIILITGCSSGFGMLAAARLAAGGHTVYATMRNLQKHDTLNLELKQRDTKCQILHLDVTDDNSISKVINTIEKQDSRLDVLINNAGYGIGGFFEDLSEDEIRSQFETKYQFIACSGRLSFELVQKTLMANIGLLMGVGAPTSLAIDLAKRFDMTLIGFVKSDSFNIYCGANRILK